MLRLFHPPVQLWHSVFMFLLEVLLSNKKKDLADTPLIILGSKEDGNHALHLYPKTSCLYSYPNSLDLILALKSFRIWGAFTG